MSDDSWQALAVKLRQFDDSFPVDNQDAMHLLERIVRDSRLRAAQMVALCSYTWAQEADHQKRINDTTKRLGSHAFELAKFWPGARIELGEDPRGMVVRIIPPNGRGDCWAGGIGVA